MTLSMLKGSQGMVDRFHPFHQTVNKSIFLNQCLCNTGNWYGGFGGLSACNNMRQSPFYHFISMLGLCFDDTSNIFDLMIIN